jgi:hypothetical protein
VLETERSRVAILTADLEASLAGVGIRKDSTDVLGLEALTEAIGQGVCLELARVPARLGAKGTDALRDDALFLPMAHLDGGGR